MYLLARNIDNSVDYDCVARYSIDTPVDDVSAGKLEQE